LKCLFSYGSTWFMLQNINIKYDDNMMRFHLYDTARYAQLLYAQRPFLRALVFKKRYFSIFLFLF